MSSFKFCLIDDCIIKYPHDHCPHKGCNHINEFRQIHTLDCNLAPSNMDAYSYSYNNYYNDLTSDECNCKKEYMVPFHSHCSKLGCKRTSFHTHCHHQGCKKVFLHAHCNYPGCNWSGQKYEDHVHCKICGTYHIGYHEHCKKDGCNRTDKHKHCKTCNYVSDNGDYHRHLQQI